MRQVETREGSQGEAFGTAADLTCISECGRFDVAQCRKTQCMRALPLGYITACQAGQREVKMVEIIEALRHEHRNIEKLLQVMEQEAQAERPD